MQARHDALAPLYAVKRLFVQRRAVKGVTPEAAAAIDGAALAAELEALIGEPLDRAELCAAMSRAGWRTSPSTSAALDLAARYAAWAALSPAGRKKHRAACCSKCRTSST